MIFYPLEKKIEYKVEVRASLVSASLEWKIEGLEKEFEYDIYVCTNSKLVKTCHVTTTSCNFNDLIPGTKYSVCIITNGNRKTKLRSQIIELQTLPETLQIIPNFGPSEGNFLIQIGGKESEASVLFGSQNIPCLPCPFTKNPCFQCPQKTDSQFVEIACGDRKGVFRYIDLSEMKKLESLIMELECWKKL